MTLQTEFHVCVQAGELTAPIRRTSGKEVIRAMGGHGVLPDRLGQKTVLQGVRQPRFVLLVGPPVGDHEALVGGV